MIVEESNLERLYDWCKAEVQKHNVRMMPPPRNPQAQRVADMMIGINREPGGAEKGELFVLYGSRRPGKSVFTLAHRAAWLANLHTVPTREEMARRHEFWAEMTPFMERYGLNAA